MRGPGYVAPSETLNLALIGDKIDCIDDGGIVFVLAAKDEFQELARNPLGEPSRSTPAVSSGRMFLRTVSQLICIAGNSP